MLGPCEATSMSHPDAVDHPLAGFFRALGHRTWTRFGTLWVDAGRFTTVTVLCEPPVPAPRATMAGFLRESGRTVAVFANEGGAGPTVGHFCLRDPGYSEASVQRQFRQQLRRAADQVEVRSIGWDELRVGGLAVNRSTMQRRGLGGNACTTPAGWDAICAAGSAVPGLEVTGALIDGRLSGFLVSWVRRDRCDGLLMHRDDRDAALGVPHALLFGFARAMIQRPGVQFVSMGRSWFPAVPSIDRFKRHAGFVAEPLTLGVVLHPGRARLLRYPWLHRALRGIERLSGGRIALEADVQVLEAAAVTRLPD